MNTDEHRFLEKIPIERILNPFYPCSSVVNFDLLNSLLVTLCLIDDQVLNQKNLDYFPRTQTRRVGWDAQESICGREREDEV